MFCALGCVLVLPRVSSLFTASSLSTASYSSGSRSDLRSSISGRISPSQMLAELTLAGLGVWALVGTKRRRRKRRRDLSSGLWFLHSTLPRVCLPRCPCSTAQQSAALQQRLCPLLSPKPHTVKAGTVTQRPLRHHPVQILVCRFKSHLRPASGYKKLDNRNLDKIHRKIR